MSTFHCCNCQCDVADTFGADGNRNRFLCPVCEKEFCAVHWCAHLNGPCYTQNAKTMETVRCIGRLHERLVANTDARDEMSADDTRCPDVMYEQGEIVTELVVALKQLEELNQSTEATPCATEQLPAKQAANEDCDWLKGYKAALRCYAFWKEGVQYVGCGVFTLEQALANVDAKQERR